MAGQRPGRSAGVREESGADGARRQREPSEIPQYNASQWVTEATRQIDIANGIEALVEALATPEY